MLPAELFAKVDAPSFEVREQAEAYQKTLTKPAGSLGRLEQIGVWMSSCQGVCPPRPIRDPRIIVFAALIYPGLPKDPYCLINSGALRFRKRRTLDFVVRRDDWPGRDNRTPVP